MKEKIKNIFAVNFFTLILFNILLVLLFLSGNIKYYVHPKMYVPLFIGAVIISVMIFAFVFDKNAAGKGKFRNYVFLIPVLSALLYPPDSLEERMSRNRGSQFEIKTQAAQDNSKGASSPGRSKTANGEDIFGDEAGTGEPMPLVIDEQIFPGNKPESPGENEIFTINETNFISALNKIYLQLAEFVNQEIRISGFAYQIDTLGENQFIIARLFMTCCAADAGVVGLACTIGESQQVSFDNWYEITGTVQKLEYNGQVLPQIMASNIRSIEKPESVYVY